MDVRAVCCWGLRVMSVEMIQDFHCGFRIHGTAEEWYIKSLECATSMYALGWRFERLSTNHVYCATL
jgi:hypothetical protein